MIPVRVVTPDGDIRHVVELKWFPRCGETPEPLVLLDDDTAWHPSVLGYVA